MSGLDNIISKIDDQAKLEADRLTKEAADTASKIDKNAENEIKKERTLIENKRQRDRELLTERIISNGELEARNKILAKKQEIINSVYKETLKELKEMDDTEYISFIEGHLKSKDSQLVVQKGREEAVKKVLPQAEVLADRYVSSGFLEIKGQIEYNNTFEALLHMVKDDSQMELAKLLFDK